jgi:peptide/nickel transport system permease protein
MGTDRWGYDILTLVLYGARYTIGAGLLIALTRLLVGGGIGLYLGVNRDAGELRPSSTLLAGVPGFVMIFFVMAGINYDSPLSPPALALIQGFVMTLLGLPAVVAAIANKTATIRRSPHITAAVATGADGRRIARRHVLPLMREDLLQMLAHEMVLVLTLLGQLAIFDLFFGGTERTLDPPAFWTVTHEWAGMVGQERIAILANHWLLLGPLFAFAFAILAFQFVATGLERRGRSGYARAPFV